jgi:hypothetical protein
VKIVSANSPAYNDVDQIPYTDERVHQLVWIKIFRKIFNTFAYLKNAIDTMLTGNVTLGAGASTITIPGLLDAQGNVNLGNTTGDTVSIKGTTQFEGPATSKNMHLGTTAGTTGDLTTLDNDFTLGTGRIVANTEFLSDADHSYTYRYRFYFALTTATRYLDVSIPNPRKGTEYHVHGDVNVAYNVMIRTNGGTTGSIGPGSTKNCLVMYDGTTWRFINY